MLTLTLPPLLAVLVALQMVSYFHNYNNYSRYFVISCPSEFHRIFFYGITAVVGFECNPWLDCRALKPSFLVCRSLLHMCTSICYVWNYLLYVHDTKTPINLGDVLQTYVRTVSAAAHQQLFHAPRTLIFFYYSVLSGAHERRSVLRWESRLQSMTLYAKTAKWCVGECYALTVHFNL